MANTIARSSTLLPTIKCSNCSVEIQIALLGEHICSGSGQSASFQPSSHRQHGETSYSHIKTPDEDLSSFLKPGLLLPRVDVNAANYSFSQFGTYTPTSAPSSPTSLNQSSFPKLMQNVPLPVSRAPPSPEPQSSNVEVGFLPFSTLRSPKNGFYRTNRPEGVKAYNELNQVYTATSPRNMDNEVLMQRMNRITPGPFDIHGQRELLKVEKNYRQKDPTVISDDAAGERLTHERIELPTNRGPGHFRSTSNSSLGSKSNYVIPPRVPSKDGYEGFGPPSMTDENLSGGSNSRNRSQSRPLNSQPSSRRSSQKQETERPNPVRTPPQGFSRQRLASDDSTMLSSPGVGVATGLDKINPYMTPPPVPLKDNPAVMYNIGNPYELLTKSSQNAKLETSNEIQVSPRSILPDSKIPSKHRRNASDTSKIDHLMADLESSMTELQTKEPRNRSVPVNQKSPPTPPLMSTSSLTQKLSENSNERPGIPRKNTAPNLSSVTKPGGDLQTSFSPPLPNRFQTVLHVSRANSRPRTSKGKCKKCGEDIYGKSVSSADGRLTGRYHKECFVCHTCQEPFQTTTFYVIKDAPYCELHYHELNGSICRSCKKGIEGQYIETDRGSKHHLGCLQCADCRGILHDVYYEMNGFFYCERDAFNRTKRQNRNFDPRTKGQARMERRTTRIMMI